MSEAQLDLSFRHHDQGSYLDRRVFRWPFTLSRGFRLDPVPAGMLTLILQTASGAINADDALLQRIHVGVGAAAHVTTQGATVVHRAPTGTGAADRVELDVADGGLIEYLPGPRILFPDSILSQHLVLRIAPTGMAVLSDGFVSHDPAGLAQGFKRYMNELVIERPQGHVAVLDRVELDGMPMHRGRRANLTAHGTLVVVAPLAPQALEALCREMASGLNGTTAIYAAASVLPHDAGVALRVAAADGRHLRIALAGGWSAFRRHVFGCDPAPRRKD